MSWNVTKGESFVNAQPSSLSRLRPRVAQMLRVLDMRPSRVSRMHKKVTRKARESSVWASAVPLSKLSLDAVSWSWGSSGSCQCLVSRFARWGHEAPCCWGHAPWDGLALVLRAAAGSSGLQRGRGGQLRGQQPCWAHHISQQPSSEG